uniref:Kinetochore protein SPC25 n=1 Tax=Angiostrongylus cantonensis TaxID=6313 RepID=A0A0K0D941_ANGCA
MKKKEADLAKWENEIGSKEQAFKSAEEHAVKAREKLNAVAQGMTTDDSGNAISAEEQITGYRSKLKEIAAEDELKSITYDEEAHLKSRETLVNFQQDVHQMQIKLNVLHQKNPRIHFTYKDPFPGFNRDDVRGCIAILFRIKDPKYALALEIAAGSFVSFHLLFDSL